MSCFIRGHVHSPLVVSASFANALSFCALLVWMQVSFREAMLCPLLYCDQGLTQTVILALHPELSSLGPPPAATVSEANGASFRKKEVTTAAARPAQGLGKLKITVPTITASLKKKEE